MVRLGVSNSCKPSMVGVRDRSFQQRSVLPFTSTTDDDTIFMIIIFIMAGLFCAKALARAFIAGLLAAGIARLVLGVERQLFGAVGSGAGAAEISQTTSNSG